MERLRSSFRSLQEAVISSIKPMGPVCIEKARTHSFREPAGDLSSCSFHGFSCTPTPSTSLSSSALSKLDDPAARWSARGLAADKLDVCARDETTAVQSSSSSSPPTTSSSSDDELDGISENLRRGSERFFFSPHSTKSIMEEAAGAGPTSSSRTASSSSSTPTSKRTAFCDESTAVAMASYDPYCDFRASMEEMVAAHELRDWRCLQELLHCYLMLNDKRNHKAIVLAFVDLLMQLRSQDSDGGFSSCSSCSS